MSVVNVSSPPSVANVQAAINSAADDDTVLFPASGSATWSSGVTISGKGITLDMNGCTITSSTSSVLISVTTDTTAATRITNGIFAGSEAGVNNPRYIIVGGGDSRPLFRIDHCTFGSVVRDTHIQISDGQDGLVDNCDFTTGPHGGEIIHHFGYGNSSETGWTYDITPGSDEAVYVEDCTFTNLMNDQYFYGGSAVQAYYGARYVARHNVCNNVQFDAHGTPGMIGCRWYEIYDNTFHCTHNPSAQDKYLQIRGGSGVLYNNVKSGTYDNDGSGSIAIYEEDTGSYPEAYQPGRGKGAKAGSQPYGQNQALNPIFVWNNSSDDGTMGNPGTDGIVVVNRDFYNRAPQSGDWIYPYTALAYPHPLRGVVCYPGVGTLLTVGKAPTLPTKLAGPKKVRWRPH